LNCIDTNRRSHGLCTQTQNLIATREVIFPGDFLWFSEPYDDLTNRNTIFVDQINSTLSNYWAKSF